MEERERERNRKRMKEKEKEEWGMRKLNKNSERVKLEKKTF
jgi:hypothetical protein